MSEGSIAARPTARDTRALRYALIALVIHAASLAIPPGWLAFSIGLRAFRDLLAMRSPDTVNPVLVLLLVLYDLSWLANPASWTAMLLLGAGVHGRAAVAGWVALVVALGALPFAFWIPSYYLWVGSMAVVVFAARRLRAQRESGCERADGSQPSPSKRRLVPSFAILVVVGSFSAFFVLGGADAVISSIDLADDPNANVHTGEDARQRILQWTGRGGRQGKDIVPTSARDFWIYEGGNFNGSIIYWVFTCGSREDCIATFDRLAGTGDPWSPSRYAVVMEGPAFYSREVDGPLKLRANPWDVRGITNGLVFESVLGDHRSMTYYAADLDRNRFYYHYESGGFPPTEYKPEKATGR